jgi:rod shape-determining protein MreB
MSVQGRDLITGKPKQVDISYKEISKALDKSLTRIEDAVMEALAMTPPHCLQIYTTRVFTWPVADHF